MAGAGVAAQHNAGVLRGGSLRAGGVSVATTHDDRRSARVVLRLDHDHRGRGRRDQALRAR